MSSSGRWGSWKRLRPTREVGEEGRELVGDKEALSEKIRSWSFSSSSESSGEVSSA